MQSMNRRTFLAASAGLAAAPVLAHDGIHSVFNGVLIGAQSYSFRDREIGAAIAGMKDIGIGECEMWMGHMEKGKGSRQGAGREELRKWRMTVDLAEFESVGRIFKQAGIELYAYNYSFREDFTDGEIERGFEMAKALGAKCITASSNVTTARRIDKFAKKAKMLVGVHNHSNIRPNEFATPEDFDKARAGTSNIAINLDIGHFVAAGFDPVDYITQHHDDIVTLHLKDRKENQGENTVFGMGDTPIIEVLHLLRENKYKIPANIEYEYKGEDTLAEVRKCFQYCKTALEM